MTKVLNFVIKYRLVLGVLFLIVAVLINLQSGFWPAFVVYLVGATLIVGHFLFGPLRLIQSRIEEGDVEGSQKILDSIWFPGLLIKPVRSVYYTLKGNLAMMNQDFDTAEKHMRKSLDLGSPVKEAEGANKLQLGMLSMQKGKIKEAESLIRQAIRAGLPDKENKAAAYLQLSSIMAQKREFRAAKDYFKRVKALNPSTPQIKEQIKKMEKYITRI